MTMQAPPPAGEITMNVKIAQENDIPSSMAYSAFANTSFSPDKRAKQYRKEYADHVNGVYAELAKLAKTPEQQEYLEEAMNRYREKYLSLTLAALNAHSRIASAFVVGPAKFPFSRNQKRIDAHEAHRAKIYDFENRVPAAIKKRLLAMRPDEQKEAEALARLKRDILSDVQTVKAIDEGREHYNRALFTASVKGKLERLARKGEIALVTRALEYIRELQADMQKPFFAARNSVWGLAEAAEKSAEKIEESARTADNVEKEYNGARIVTAPSDDRVRILFDEKPATEVIAALKRSAWKWSPKNKAWQRKLTQNAIACARQICDRYF